MKKVVFAFVSFLAVSVAIGQTKKGDKLVGVSFGSLSYTNSKSITSYSNTPTVYNSDGNSFSFSVNPNVAWFINDNFALGGLVSISFYTSKSNSSNTGSTTTSESKYNQPAFYIGPMARYYFSGSAKGMPFVQGNFQWGISGGKSNSSTSTGASSETKYKPKGDWNGGVSFGYEHFVTPNVGIWLHRL